MFETKIIKTSDEGPFENHIWKYNLMLPKHLAEWDVWDYWERPMLDTMQERLKQGDIIFDIGTEAGYFAALFGKYMVGGENVIMFEPDDTVWDMIDEIWKANGLDKPKAKWHGFVSDTSNKIKERKPKPFAGPHAYKYLSNQNDFRTTPRITIDDFVKKEGLEPKAIKVDVEGSEFLVLKGAEKTLKKVKPFVWVSIHPDLMQTNHQNTPEDIMQYMNGLGYQGTHLSTDHEQHWLFEPQN